MLTSEQSMENVLQNINKLNRGLESVIAVCTNEFSQVEGLWSQLENVMAKQPESDASKDTKDGATEEQNQ
jgi:DASH complex subunit DAD1